MPGPCSARQVGIIIITVASAKPSTQYTRRIIARSSSPASATSPFRHFVCDPVQRAPGQRRATDSLQDHRRGCIGHHCPQNTGTDPEASEELKEARNTLILDLVESMRPDIEHSIRNIKADLRLVITRTGDYTDIVAHEVFSKFVKNLYEPVRKPLIRQTWKKTLKLFEEIIIQSFCRTLTRCRAMRCKS